LPAWARSANKWVGVPWCGGEKRAGKDARVPLCRIIAWNNRGGLIMPAFLRVSIFAVLLSVAISGCKSAHDKIRSAVSNSNSSSSSGKPDDKGLIHSGTGTGKEKPAAGKTNVQGKVLFNEKPAANIEVKLCEKFNQYLGGCGGQTYTTRTDSNGEYLIKDVPPGIYEGLTAKVFDTPYYVFATSGFITSAKYQLEPDETFFAPDSNLFKSDLKLVNPKAGAKLAPDNIEIKWESYPDAAYYKFSINADSSSGAQTNLDYINKRVDGTSYVLDKPLDAGSYRISVVAYNANDIKLA
jgi:hypothetical protein